MTTHGLEKLWHVESCPNVQASPIMARHTTAPAITTKASGVYVSTTFCTARYAVHTSTCLHMHDQATNKHNHTRHDGMDLNQMWPLSMLQQTRCGHWWLLVTSRHKRSTAAHPINQSCTLTEALTKNFIQHKQSPTEPNTKSNCTTTI